METAEMTVPKQNAHQGENFPIFEDTGEEVERVLSSSPGKILLLSEGDFAFADAATGVRAISLIFDGDALPLFSMPDGVSCVLASGGENLLVSARYFAEVRRIPCVLFPCHTSLDGCCGERGRVRLGEEEAEVPLAQAKIVCDRERLSGTLAEGYGRILLARLGDLERRALAQFLGRRAEERRDFDEDVSLEAIVGANFRERTLYAQKESEGVLLSRLLREKGEKYPEWRAFLQLSALYAAFFEKGKPRRYFTPDYKGRSMRAGTEYARTKIPTAEEYAVRAITLERIRAVFAKEALALIDQKMTFLKEISALNGEVLPLRAGDLSCLKSLPEHAPDSLSAIIRDFGLMEWNV